MAGVFLTAGQTHFEMWKNFALKGHGFSRAAESCQ